MPAYQTHLGTCIPATLQQSTFSWQYTDLRVTNPYPVQGVQPGVLSAVALQQSQWPLR